MTEFEKQIPKEGFQTADAKFMGYADEPKEGEGKKGKWRKTKLSFQISGKDKPNKFVMWSPLKSAKTVYKHDSELKQFAMYRIVWVESDQAYNGNEWVEKNIVVIKDATGEPPSQAKQRQPSESSAGADISTELDLSKFDSFKELYFSACEKKNIEPNISSMVGSFLRGYDNLYVEQLVNRCRAAILAKETASKEPTEGDVEEIVD